MILETEKASKVIENAHRLAKCKLFAQVAGRVASNLSLTRENREFRIPSPSAELHHVQLEERTVV
jgi:hypothetical protein